MTPHEQVKRWIIEAPEKLMTDDEWDLFCELTRRMGKRLGNIPYYPEQDDNRMDDK